MLPEELNQNRQHLIALVLTIEQNTLKGIPYETDGED
jgi:hypothetical protein